MNFRKTKYVNYLKSAFNVEIVYTHFKFLKDKFQFNLIIWSSCMKIWTYSILKIKAALLMGKKNYLLSSGTVKYFSSLLYRGYRKTSQYVVAQFNQSFSSHQNLSYSSRGKKVDILLY